jgi:hypothetical protein
MNAYRFRTVFRRLWPFSPALMRRKIPSHQGFMRGTVFRLAKNG